MATLNLKYEPSSKCFTYDYIELVFEDEQIAKMIHVDYDYTNYAPGTAYYTISAWGSVQGEAKGSFKITKADIADKNVKFDITAEKNLKTDKLDFEVTEASYNGRGLYDIDNEKRYYNYGICPIDESDNDIYVIDGENYRLVKEDDMVVGNKYAVKVVGLGEYFEGERYVEFEYSLPSIYDEDIKGRHFDLTYTGSALTVEIVRNLRQVARQPLTDILFHMWVSETTVLLIHLK